MRATKIEGPSQAPAEFGSYRNRKPALRLARECDPLPLRGSRAAMALLHRPSTTPGRKKQDSTWSPFFDRDQFRGSRVNPRRPSQPRRACSAVVRCREADAAALLAVIRRCSAEPPVRENICNAHGRVPGMLGTAVRNLLKWPWQRPICIDIRARHGLETPRPGRHAAGGIIPFLPNPALHTAFESIRILP